MSQDFSGTNGYHNATTPSTEHTIANTVAKKLIVCCDGTWMDSDNGYTKGSHGHPGTMQNPTNVTRIARAITPQDDAHHPQIVFYQAGVGTGMGITSQMFGGGMGLGLSEHIREGYAFLVNNYRQYNPKYPKADPDSIFIIGFSRGAYTARSIAGFIGAVGLLKKKAMPHFYEVFQDWENAGNKEYTPQFWRGFYQMHPDKGKAQPDIKLARDRGRIDEYLTQYRKILLSLDLTQEVTINIVGVWDTVGALGIPVNPIIQKLFPFLPSVVKEYGWFDTRIGTHIKNAFHALALDEHRYPFSPTLWEKPSGATTNLKQVWFPGAHSNVGGSYPDTGVADITLAWMMDQLCGSTTEHPDGFVHREWIKFDEDYVQYWEKTMLTAKQEAADHIYKGWGMGYVYESMYFPMTLLGKAVRAPGCYHRVDLDTGKPTNQMLENTNEYIHSCVRARTDLGGRGVEQDWSQVFPNSIEIWPAIIQQWRKMTGQPAKDYHPMRPYEPLHKWRLNDGHVTHFPTNMELDTRPDGLKEITWEYEGKGPCSTRVMKEDKMGPFELRLLRKDPAIAKQVQFTNDSWHWVATDTAKKQNDMV